MISRRSRDERGAVAILAGVTFSILFLVAALVVDLGLARDVRRQSQNATDASALAAGNSLYPATSCTTPVGSLPPCFSDAVATAKSYAAVNFETVESDWDACTDPGRPSGYYIHSGSSACISFDSATNPTKVRIRLPVRDVKTGFGALAGVDSIAISSVARSSLLPGEARGCGLCVVAPDPSDLGNGDVSVSGGSIHVNGSVSTGPNGAMTASPVGSTISVVGSASGNFNPPRIGPPTAGTVADPLASTLGLPPDMAGLSTKTAPCATGATGGPGIYGALTLPNSSCTLTPGLYVLTGIWDMRNNTSLNGAGVTIYGTCGSSTTPRVCNSPGEVGGGLDVKNGLADLVAPLTGPLAGYVVIYDRQNKAALTLQGNGDTDFVGTIYAPQALLSFPGNSCVNVVNGPVIVGSLYGNGNRGCVNLSEVNSAALPSTPGAVNLDQ